MALRTLTPSSVRPPVDKAAQAAVATTVLAWASAFVVIRWVGDSYSPGPLALGRLLVGSAALGGLLLVRGGWVRPSAREWWLLTLCAVVWFAIYNVALNAAEQSVDAGTTAMLINVGPILIALFAGTLLGEGFPRWLLVGAGIAFSGALLIGVSTSESRHADLLGMILCLVAAGSYAVGVLAQKPVLRRLPSLQVVWLSCTIGALGCLPYLPALATEADAASAGATSAVVYLGVVPTALAFTTWAYALARMDAGRLGITTYLVPPVTIVVAWALLDEVPHPLALLGGLVCLAGVAVSRRRD
jgi:drug/metabolite transporter (DMT)-like permease